MITETAKAYDPNMGSLDDIDDLPAFKAPPSGGYKLLLEKGFVFKPDINKHPAETFDFKVLEIIEQSEVVPEAEQIKVGDTFNIAYMMDNPTGAGFFKEMLAPLKEKFGTGNIAELRKNSVGLEITAIVARTFDKTKQQHYAKIKGYTL